MIREEILRVISNKKYKKLVNKLGAKAQFAEIKFTEKLYCQGVIARNKLHKIIYIPSSSAEWVLSNAFDPKQKENECGAV